MQTIFNYSLSLPDTNVYLLLVTDIITDHMIIAYYIPVKTPIKILQSIVMHIIIYYGKINLLRSQQGN